MRVPVVAKNTHIALSRIPSQSYEILVNLAIPWELLEKLEYLLSALLETGLGIYRRPWAEFTQEPADPIFVGARLALSFCFVVF